MPSPPEKLVGRAAQGSGDPDGGRVAGKGGLARVRIDPALDLSEATEGDPALLRQLSKRPSPVLPEPVNEVPKRFLVAWHTASLTAPIVWLPHKWVKYEQQIPCLILWQTTFDTLPIRSNNEIALLRGTMKKILTTALLGSILLGGPSAEAQSQLNNGENRQAVQLQERERVEALLAGLSKIQKAQTAALESSNYESYAMALRQELAIDFAEIRRHLRSPSDLQKPYSENPAMYAEDAKRQFEGALDRLKTLEQAVQDENYYWASEAEIRRLPVKTSEAKEILGKIDVVCIMLNALDLARKNDFFHADAALSNAPESTDFQLRLEALRTSLKARETSVIAKEKADQAAQEEADRKTQATAEIERKAKALAQNALETKVRQELIQALKAKDEKNTQAKFAAFKKAVGGNGVRDFLESSSISIKTGKISNGVPLLVAGSVETVADDGLMVILDTSTLFSTMARHYGLSSGSQDAIRVFIRTKRDLGLVDGDTLFCGVLPRGSFSYTTVSGSKATVRAFELKAIFQE